MIRFLWEHYCIIYVCSKYIHCKTFTTYNIANRSKKKILKTYIVIVFPCLSCTRDKYSHCLDRIHQCTISVPDLQVCIYIPCMLTLTCTSVVLSLLAPPLIYTLIRSIYALLSNRKWNTLPLAIVEEYQWPLASWHPRGQLVLWAILHTNKHMHSVDAKPPFLQIGQNRIQIIPHTSFRQCHYWVLYYKFWISTLPHFVFKHTCTSHRRGSVSMNTSRHRLGWQRCTLVVLLLPHARTCM